MIITTIIRVETKPTFSKDGARDQQHTQRHTKCEREMNNLVNGFSAQTNGRMT